MIFLCIAIAASFFILNILFEDDTQSKENPQEKYTIPCLDKDTKSPLPGSVFVRVLNGSGKSGLGTAVGDSLQIRGFSIVGVTNAPFKTDYTQIRYGLNALSQAVLLSNHFSNAVLVLDDRSDGMIDLIVGHNFSNLIEKELVPTLQDSSVFDNKCVDSSKIKVQKAIDHDINKVPAYTDEENSQDESQDNDANK